MKQIVLTALLWVCATAANAERLYVSDKLVVNVYAEANQESDKLASLESGDAIEAGEKAEGYTRVNLADGREGWIKSSYLSAQVPALVRVKELEKERSAGASVPTAAVEELKLLKERNTALQGELEALKRTTAQAASQAAAEAARPSTSATSPVAPIAEEGGSLHALKWSAAIALAAGVLGYFLGYRNIARRIERKYGKLKIY